MTYTKTLWGFLGLYFFIEIIWIKFASFSFYYSDNIVFYYFIFMFSILSIYIFYKNFRPDPRIEFLLISALLFFTNAFLTLIGSYLAATLNFPFVDSQLASIDEGLGIYTPNLVFWFRNHLNWYNFFIYIYNSYAFQFPLIIFYLNFCKKEILLQRFFMQVFIAGLLTVCLSGLFPVAGPYVHYGYTPDGPLASALQHLYELRQNIVNINTANGIVSLPSFHSVMALLYIYSLRQENNYIFIPALILNILVIFSCLPIGQHYFIDILAAFPVFLFAVWSERLLFSYIHYLTKLQVSKQMADFKI